MGTISDFTPDECTALYKVLYQSRDFTCKKCGITFAVYSDSKIAEQRLCTDCARGKE